jgi:hypothetical protein
LASLTVVTIEVNNITPPAISPVAILAVVEIAVIKPKEAATA